MKLPMRRSWLLLGAGTAVALIAIQLVPYGHGRTNPPASVEPAWDSPATRELARRACFDCHSNHTDWPAYARIAPASWLIQHDVDEGRRKLNFSEWDRAQKEAKEAAEEVREGEMPPAIYRVMHAHARLNDADRARLAQGLAKTVAASGYQEHAEY